jgi:hypothetical protein
MQPVNGAKGPEEKDGFGVVGMGEAGAGEAISLRPLSEF